MTVRKLIELLQAESPDALVVVQKDAEGNGYTPLYAVSRDGYLAETTWSGERKLLELTPDHATIGYTQDDVAEGAVPAVFLVPVN